MSTKKQNVVKKTSKTIVKNVEVRESSKDRSKAKTEEKKVVKSVRKGEGDVRTPRTASLGSKPTPRKTVSKSPTSSRVAKSQFFPSKTMYSAALKANNQPKPDTSRGTEETKTQPKLTKSDSSLSRTRKTETKTVTKSPKTKPSSTSETKVASKPKNLRPMPAALDIKPARTPIKATPTSLKNVPKKEIKTPKDTSSDTSNTNSLERPRTATLRKGSIVNMNIAGPDIPITPVKQHQPQADEFDYEDDFDSYASDFEDYKSSTNSETSSSDGNIQTEGEISTSSSPSEQEPPPKRQNSAEEERKLDSGNFDLPENKHKPMLDNINESVASLSDEGFEEAKSLQFVNFLGAKKIQEKRRKSRRGEELMSMIRLDAQNFTLFDIPAVSYDVFIKSFGNQNCVQVSSQTGEDDVSEESQTDFIETIGKWTQFPTKFTETDNVNLLRAEFVGSGSDELEDVHIKYNENHLESFLKNSAELISSLMRYDVKEFEVDENLNKFSVGFLEVNTSFLVGRKVSSLVFCKSGSRFVSLHTRKSKEDEEDISYKNIGCVWCLSDVQTPEAVFTSYGNVEVVSVGNSKLIFGGLQDGTVSVWDLSRIPSTLSYLRSDSVNKIPLKPPTFTTPVCADCGGKVIAIECFDFAGNDDAGKSDWKTKTSTQIITLDENGIVTIWGLITKPTLGVSLVKNSTISLPSQHQNLQDLICTDLGYNHHDPNHIYVATNYGYILHSLISGTKAHPRAFTPQSISCVRCLEVHPDSPNYFLAGFEDGNISLYSRFKEKPLITMESQTGIDSIRWSVHKPCQFYVKDVENSINIWDLSISELFPIHSIPYKEIIDFVELSPRNSNDTRVKSFMAIATKEGNILLHILNKDQGPQPAQTFESELKMFNNYVKRL